MILTICKLILFFFSNWGYWEFFHKKSRMNPYFLPAFTVSLQVSALFCAGILNCLRETMIILYGIGFALAFIHIFKSFKDAKRDTPPPGIFIPTILMQATSFLQSQFSAFSLH